MNSKFSTHWGNPSLLCSLRKVPAEALGHFWHLTLRKSGRDQKKHSAASQAQSPREPEQACLLRAQESTDGCILVVFLYVDRRRYWRQQEEMDLRGSWKN